MRDLDCLPKIKSKAHHRLISPLRALGVAVSLRQALIAVSNTMLVQQGQQTKMEQVYHYLTGTKFKQRVDAVIEKFNDMRDDLDKERKFMTRQWSKRKTLIYPSSSRPSEWLETSRRSRARRCPRSPAWIFHSLRDLTRPNEGAPRCVLPKNIGRRSPGVTHRSLR